LGAKASTADFSYSKVYTMVATAYTAGPESTGKSPGMPGYGITASGMRVRPGVVSVDPRVIPLGTQLYVEGYGYSIAADTGGAIKGNRIDVYMESLSDAYRWGRKTVQVYVLN
jgi:3D (Asp-Asp-Asp) domain-containing protein